MNRVEEKLAGWYQLVKDLEDARSRLEAAPTGPVRKKLRAEVRRLRQEGDVALDAVSEAIAAERESVSDLLGGGTQLPVGGVGHNDSNSFRRRKVPLH